MPTVLDAIEDGIVEADQAAIDAFRYELVPAAARGETFDSRRVQQILKEANKTPDDLREESREMKERLEVFAARQSNADALRQADELKATIASTAAVLVAATADLRAQIEQVERSYREELKQLNDERHALLAGVELNESFDERIRRSMPSWLHAERSALSRQAETLRRRREQLEHLKDKADQQQKLGEVDAESAALRVKFARIDHVAATIPWPTPDDLAE